MSKALPLSLFDYRLPAERIAQAPVSPRDHSRLMVLPRRAGAVAHHRFDALPQLLRSGDLLVVNRTRVVPARLRAKKPTGGKVELLCVRPVEGGPETALRWRVMGRPGKALRAGARLQLQSGDLLHVEGREGEEALVRGERPLWEALQSHGEMPLPPYIERPEGGLASDHRDYQTIFAQEPGAVAAPTASLHFTSRLLQALDEMGVQRAELVLHVGPGTFLPVRPEHAEDVRGHTMHGEWYDIPEPTRAVVKEAMDAGRRVIAVGTTTARALESWGGSGESRGESQLFVYPGYDFRVVDGLITNFHLPRSTLLMLVSALVGRERLLDAYAEAVAMEYRFYSYGDAMLIL